MDKIVFVHLSDIHFNRSSGHSIHDLDDEIRNELVRDAKKETSNLGPVTGVLVSGDIAFSGKRIEYSNAASWLSNFCDEIGCRDENVSVVPGNHDVDRSVAASIVTKRLHDIIRTKPPSEIDDELRELLTDDQAGKALLAPLEEFNKFAEPFECSVTADNIFWERDLTLSCGTILRLRGLCSVLVSNESDAKNRLVLGSAQANVNRDDGVIYLTMCHHPLDWLNDSDIVSTYLDSKVHIQLFGHKHSQRVQIINGKLRVTAGAMHPERADGNWEPVYNLLEIERINEDIIRVRLYQRRWHKTEHCFVADPNPITHEDFYEELLEVQGKIVRNERDTKPEEMPPVEPEAPIMARPDFPEKEPDTMPRINFKRRLTYRFLTLPYRHQIDIATRLNVLEDDDQALNGEALYRVLFRRTRDYDRLAELWAETERHHDDPAEDNPFKSPEKSGD